MATLPMPPVAHSRPFGRWQAAGGEGKCRNWAIGGLRPRAEGFVQAAGPGATTLPSH